MNHSQSSKPCRRCEIVKPLTDFYERSESVKNTLYQSYCKKCMAARKHERLVAKGHIMPTRVRFDPITNEDVKVCTLCRIEKSVAKEYGRMRDVRGNDRCKSRCRKCELVANLEYRQRHPERLKEIRRRSNLKRMEKNRMYRQENRERNAIQKAEWLRNNPGKRSEYQARRLRRLKGNIDRRAIIRRDASTCYLCHKVLNRPDIHLDHIVPLERGGTHTEGNLKVACSPCNLRKSTKLLSELNLASFL